MPDKRKPPVVGTSGFQKFDVLAGNIDEQEDTPNHQHLQAHRVRNRFAISWPVARRVAELAYPSGGAV